MSCTLTEIVPVAPEAPTNPAMEETTGSLYDTSKEKGPVPEAVTVNPPAPKAFNRDWREPTRPCAVADVTMPVE